MKKYIFLLLIMSLSTMKVNAETNTKTEDSVQFLAVESSDVILIESNGRYGLIDGGEDVGTSRKVNEAKGDYEEVKILENLQGHDQYVKDYLNKAGVKKLDFIIATHSHSDHIGLTDTIIKEFGATKLYTKTYSNGLYKDQLGKMQKLFTCESEYTYDNTEVYNDMINAAKAKGTEIIYIDKLPDYKEVGNFVLNFKFEDFNISILNTSDYNDETAKAKKKKFGENSNSLGVVIKKGDRKIFTAGDIINSDEVYAKEGDSKPLSIGDETKLISDVNTASLIKDVDVFKIAHHGLNGTIPFIKHINPKQTIVTNGSVFNAGAEGYESMKALGYSNVFGTKDNGDIKIIIDDNGKIITNGWRYDCSKNTWAYYINGNPVTGWKNILSGNKYNWYYFNEKFEMAKGWNFINYNGKKSWFYFGDDGSMKTGFNKIDNKWYYLQEDMNSLNPDSSKVTGEMITGWKSINYLNTKMWYYFNTDGSMVRGWNYINNEWYYFQEQNAYEGGTYYPEGSMISGWRNLFWIDQTNWYYFDASGKMSKGFKDINGKTYYFQPESKTIGNKKLYAGSMATGTQTISVNGTNKICTFDSSGALISRK